MLSSREASTSSRLRINVYRSLLGRDDIWASVDRYGIMRPTKRIPSEPLPSDIGRCSVPEGFQGEDKPEWKTISKWLHWDLNPCTSL